MIYKERLIAFLKKLVNNQQNLVIHVRKQPEKFVGLLEGVAYPFQAVIKDGAGGVLFLNPLTSITIGKNVHISNGDLKSFASFENGFVD